MRFVFILLLMAFGFELEAKSLNLQEFKALDQSTQVQILKGLSRLHF